MCKQAVLVSQTGDPRGPHLALQATWFSPTLKTPVAMESVDFPYRKQIVRLTLLIFPSAGPPQQYTIWKLVIQTECSRCFLPNDLHFLFCQQCGTPQLHTTSPDKALKAPLIDSHPLAVRWEALETYIAASKYRRKRSALEVEFTSFLARSSPPKSLDNASPRDIIYFLIWKDKDSKTKVHGDGCPHQGRSSKHTTVCNCPLQLAFKTVDSYIGQLRAIFRDHLEASGTTCCQILLHTCLGKTLAKSGDRRTAQCAGHPETS